MWNSCNANICYIRYNLKLKSLLIIINRYTLSIFNSYIYPVITRYKIKIFKFYLISSVFINVKILYSVYSCISTIAPESIISEYTKSKYCISNFIINVLVLILVLYFMLVGGRKMEDYIIDILPFNQRNKRDVLHEFHMVVKSNAIGVPLLAIIQGGIAMLGYYIFGAPEVILWGVVSCFATVIPVIGVAIVWIPLALYIGATGHWWMALGLSVYCIVIVANVDNLIRSVLQRKMADTHPLITIFGVVIGLSLFGFMGIIFGPLLLSIFVLCVQIFKAEYLEEPQGQKRLTGRTGSRT